MLVQLKQWKEQGLLRSIDYHFAKFIGDLGGDKLTILSAAFASEYLGMGHICLPLEQIAGHLNDKCLSSELNLQHFCQSHNIECLLQNNQDSHALLSESVCVGEQAPLTLQFNALYLNRYAQFEQLIADKFLMQPEVVLKGDIKAELDALFAVNYSYLWQAWCADKTQAVRGLCEKFLDIVPQASVNWPQVETVFSEAKQSSDLQQLDAIITESQRCNWQKVSAALALSSARCVISGGPGTGKTTTVTKLLALLLKVKDDLLIKLVAPTGKAAARLTESITHALTELDIDEQLKVKIPTEASTIHRLLGVKANSSHFRHDHNNQLHLDLLLVDEASMVDLSLMAKLLMALPAHARLILLGDKDQLASVEAGAVLGDICAFIDSGYSEQKARLLADITGFDSLVKAGHGRTGMADNLCLLRKSYRFDQFSGIGYLAKAVNSGKASSRELLKLCRDYDDLRYFTNNEQGFVELDRLILTGYAPYLKRLTVITENNRNHAKALLKTFNQFKILCATRHGEWGVREINQRCEKVLTEAQLIDKQVIAQENNYNCWYPGRPIMITENNYLLGLYNGDIGICLLNEENQLRVYFQMADGSIADFQSSRLPSFETVFAMTVHKSQGSEFSHTVLALPETLLPVVTRELIYTGITRAKKQLSLFADLRLIASASKLKTQRASRLVERLQVTSS
jgi:exodeoxyribonuclease V alpha subunit